MSPTTIVDVENFNVALGFEIIMHNYKMLKQINATKGDHCCALLKKEKVECGENNPHYCIVMSHYP